MVKQQSENKDRLFLLACLGLGLLAEWSFFHGTIGVSYFVFITAFYFVFFQRFSFPFEHRRIGSLLMVSIWMMAGSYTFYDSTVFNHINLIIIPLLMFFQVILLKSPAKMNWSKLSFMRLVTGKFIDMVKYLTNFVRVMLRRLLYRKEKRSTIRRIIIALIFAVPLVVIAIELLTGGEERFSSPLLNIRLFSLEVNILEIILRLGITLIIGLCLFSYFQIVSRRTKWDIQIKENIRKTSWDGLIVAIILIVLNIIYLLFITTEVRYLLQQQLEGDRNKGFANLILAVLFNLFFLILFLKRVTTRRKQPRILLKILYSLLIMMSGFLLIIALNRVSLYENIAGYTVARFLAYVLIFYLLVIFSYTLIRVWIEHLSILHFYLITGLIFYSLIQIVNIEGFVVERNLQRYEVTGEIDFDYMSELGAEGIKGLVSLYKTEPENESIQAHLQSKKILEHEQAENWQSFNYARKEAKELLAGIELDADEEVD